MLKQISVLLLISITYQTLKNRNSNFSLRHLSENNISSNQNLTFKNIPNDSNYFFIWPENCQLNTNYSNAINNKKFIQIELKNQSSLNLFLNIEKKYDENSLCRFNSDYYNNNLLLKENINYGFEAGNFNFTFSSLEYTNPVYYIYFNKNGSGNLYISISNESNSKKEITLTNNNPYNIFFINRENLFSNCSDKEPYNCTLKIEISGNNIPFTLLIKNSHDNIPTYFIPNEMIFGIGESFSPVFFYTEIPYNSEGEVFINYKKGGTIAIGKIVNKEKRDSNGKNEQNNNLDLEYDFFNKKINDIRCENYNGCFLYVGIYINDFQVNGPSDFSFFFRFTDLVNKDAVNIFVNEFVFGNVNSRNDVYNLTINKNINLFNLIFDSEFCNLTVKLNDKEIQLNGDDKLYFYNLNNNNEDTILSLNISKKYNTVIIFPFYSLKILIPESNNIQLIKSEHMEYCNISNTNTCYFAYPIIDNETITEVSFYAFNEDYPLNEINISIKEIDINSNLSNIDNEDFFTSNNSVLIHKINKNEIYIIIKVTMKEPLGIITLLTNSYPIYEKKTLIPNSINLFHFPSTNNYLNYILLKGKNLQTYNFLKINNENKFNFPTDSQNRTLTNINYSYNIYPNKELDESKRNKNIINYFKEGDYLLSTKTSSNNKVNSFKLNINDKPNLMLKKYNNNYLPILMYMKKPKSINNNISIPIKLTSLENDNLTDLFSIECGYISEDNLLQLELKNTLNKDDTNEFQSISCKINDNLTINNMDINNYLDLKYIFIYIDKINFKTVNSTNNSIVYSNLTESSTIQTTIDSSKTTGFQFTRNESKQYLKINFFLPYYFDFFYHFINISGDTSDSENKVNSSVPLTNYNFRRRFIYLIEDSLFNNGNNGIRFYFYNSTQKRFLEETTSNSIPITLKYELLNEFDIYHIKNEKIIIITNITTLNKNITIYPLINDNNNEIENVNYSILLYDSSLTDEEIDSLNNPQSPLLEITKYTKNEDGTMSFTINKNTIDNNNCKLTANAIVNDDEIVNYNIYTIDMESNNTDNYIISDSNYDNNINPYNYFIKNNNGKKSKWWIALIIIGVILIIVIIIVLYLKMKKKNKGSNDDNNYNNTLGNGLESRNDTQEKFKSTDDLKTMK